MSDPAPVLIVHGLWLRGYEFFLLGSRLRSAGFAPSIFHYRSMHESLDDATSALAARLRRFGGPVHVVAHSLGGLVAFETYARERDLPPGRVVLMGSPLQGCRSARAVAAWSIGPSLLGGLASAELCRHCDRRWESAREIGVIAGSQNLGLGRLVAKLPLPNDGTICVDETRLPGATEHVILDVSHTGMLVSTAVAQGVIRFLRHGSFERSQ